MQIEAAQAICLRRFFQNIFSGLSKKTRYVFDMARGEVEEYASGENVPSDTVKHVLCYFADVFDEVREKRRSR